MLAAEIDGTSNDGGPCCSTVALLVPWHLAFRRRSDSDYAGRRSVFHHGAGGHAGLSFQLDRGREPAAAGDCVSRLTNMPLRFIDLGLETLHANLLLWIQMRF